MDAHFELPAKPGAYWDRCEKRQAFRICEVVKQDGQLRAKFTDGSFQRWCGDKSYFVGPIQEPVIAPDGKITNTEDNG